MCAPTKWTQLMTTLTDVGHEQGKRQAFLDGLAVDSAASIRHRSAMAFDEDRDFEEMGRLLQGWLTGQTGEPCTVQNVDCPMGTGFSSETVLFERVTDAAVEPLVARLAPTEAMMFPSYDIGLQHKVLTLLEPTPVPVPRVRWFEPTDKPFGTPLYIMDRVDGQVPSDNPPMHVDGWMADELTPEQRAQVWWSGVDAMCEVHKLDWRKSGFEFLLEPERGDTTLDQQLHFYEEYFSWGTNRDNWPLTQRALDYLHANKPANEPDALCWGDSRLANQIFQGTQCAAVLDWEMVRIGNPVQDVAWWIASDRCFSEGLEFERLQGLPGHEETLGYWSEKTGFSTEHFKYYQVLALMRFSINMARVKQHMIKLEMIDPDDEDSFDVTSLVTTVLQRALEA